MYSEDEPTFLGSPKLFFFFFFFCGTDEVEHSGDNALSPNCSPIPTVTRVHSHVMTTNVLQLLPPSNHSSQFSLLLLLMCIIAMKLATSPPATYGPKRTLLSWNCNRDFLCLEVGRQGSIWATMSLVMSTCITLVSQSAFKMVLIGERLIKKEKQK